MLEKLKDYIAEKFGEEIRYSYQCIALELSIYEETGEHLGLTTLKRIFGFAEYSNLPRKSTLDILSKYVGFKNYSEFKTKNPEGEINSDFTEVELIDCEKLGKGERIKLRYHPDRQLKLMNLGGDKFEVIAVSGGKLREGDTLTIHQIVKGFELVVSEVERDGKSLGSYVAARQGGIISIYRRPDHKR